jgi:hypothetical protein
MNLSLVLFMQDRLDPTLWILVLERCTNLVSGQNQFNSEVPLQRCFLPYHFFGLNLSELGPLTLGFERWANLPPSEVRLQSFGHASVDEEGNLVIKLIGIDGEVKLEKTISPSFASEPPEVATEPPATDGTPETATDTSFTDGAFSVTVSLVVLFVTLAMLLLLL